MSDQITREYLDQKFDEFGRMVVTGFQHAKEDTDQQFAGVNQQFAKIDQQFAGVNQQFAKIDQQFTEVNRRIDKLYNLIDGFIGLHQKLDQELTILRAKYARLEDDIAKIKLQLHIA